jgi:hypothetical protein
MLIESGAGVSRWTSFEMGLNRVECGLLVVSALVVTAPLAGVVKVLNLKIEENSEGCAL